MTVSQETSQSTILAGDRETERQDRTGQDNLRHVAVSDLGAREWAHLRLAPSSSYATHVVRAPWQNKTREASLKERICAWEAMVVSAKDTQAEEAKGKLVAAVSRTCWVSQARTQR